jgi:hypothetical protein
LPWIGGRGVVLADDAGDLPLADVLATNDMPDLRRDGQVCLQIDCMLSAI